MKQKSFIIRHLREHELFLRAFGPFDSARAASELVSGKPMGKHVRYMLAKKVGSERDALRVLNSGVELCLDAKTHLAGLVSDQNALADLILNGTCGVALQQELSARISDQVIAQKLLDSDMITDGFTEVKLREIASASGQGF